MISEKSQYGKVIKVSTQDYEELHSLKFDLRKDTFGEVISQLLSEYRQTKGASK